MKNYSYLMPEEEDTHCRQSRIRNGLRQIRKQTAILDGDNLDQLQIEVDLLAEMAESLSRFLQGYLADLRVERKNQKENLRPIAYVRDE